MLTFLFPVNYSKVMLKCRLCIRAYGEEGGSLGGY